MSYLSPMPPAPTTSTSTSVTRAPQTAPVHDATGLVGGEGTALIVLDDKTYTLRITRARKLILTK